MQLEHSSINCNPLFYPRFILLNSLKSLYLQERWKFSAFSPKISPLKPLILLSEPLLWSSLKTLWLELKIQARIEVEDEVSPLVFPLQIRPKQDGK